MRIGIYDPYLDDLGGGEKYMMTIAQILSREHEVSIFWDDKSDLDKISQRFGLDLSKVSLYKNIFSDKFSLLKRLIASAKFDLIIFLSDGSLPLVNSKLLVHIQQPLEEMQNDLMGKIKTSRVSLFFCNSEYTKTFINKKFNLKTEILFPPVKVKARDLIKENIILHVGRFRTKNVINDDYKKQGVMVNEFKRIIDKGLKGWKFVLAVSVLDKDKEEFEKMIKTAKGYPIEFLINKSNDELWEIYSKAKIYWHASGFGEDLVKHPEFAEHFGISTVEAMGAGTVPVVINAGGQKEIVTEKINGLLWESLDELEEKTLSLINNKDLLMKLSKKAKERAKDFNDDNFSKKINQIINV